jgi:mevalonate kinase
MAEANGKIILFGEHFVVHGAPAIAAGISSKVVVDVEESDMNRIITEHKVIEKMSLDGIQRVLAVMGIRGNYDVHLKGDLRTYGGLGSSAAFCVALVKALAEKHDMHLTKEEINRFAYEGEKAFHGDPSGIDNTVACYGGIVEFRKTAEGNAFEFFEAGKELDVVVSFTGKYSPTAKMVESVRNFKEQDEDEFRQLKDEYSELEMRGRKALQKGQIDVIGRCMNENQSLLSEVGVSDERNDRIIKIMLDEGALGAKLTGGGGGGCCIALAKNNEHAASISESLVKEGFDTFTAKIR